MRAGFLGSLITATQRQLLWPSIIRMLFLITCLITPGYASFLFSSSTLDVLTVQYSVSVIVDGMVFLKGKDVRLFS